MQSIFTFIRHVERAVLAWGILGIAALTVVNVFCRSVLGLSLASVEELCQFAIILVTFVGLSHGASEGRHIRMTALYDQLSDRGRKVAMVIICAVTAALLFALFAFSLSYIGTVKTLGTRSPALGVAYWLVYLSAPLGLFLGGVQYLLAVARNLTTEGVWLSWDAPDAYDDGAVPLDGV